MGDAPHPMSRPLAAVLPRPALIRKAVAVLVCATLLPWQAPAAALAQENTDQTSAPAPVSDDDAAKAKPFNVDLAKPGARGEAIGKTLTERVDDLKNAKLAVDAAAALQDAFKKLAADAEQLHKDLDGLKAAAKPVGDACDNRHNDYRLSRR